MANAHSLAISPAISANSVHDSLNASRVPDMNLALLWIPATLAASVAQTARNATQRQLTETIGTVGATQVRFLYGFPFALLFLLAISLVTGEAVPGPSRVFYLFLAGGAVTQILATALMLAAMRERSFSVVTAYIKTEPVQTALFGLAVLGDPLSWAMAAAIAVATLGVVLISLKPGVGLATSGWRPVAMGVGAGAFFALSAIFFRGAILSLGEASFLMRATTTLAWSLGTQTGIL